jgi:ankyrin repeat protein
VEGGGHTDFRARDGMTPVHKAAVHGMHRALQALLDLGASPDLRDSQALTPLYHACCSGGSPRCAELLLQDRAQVNVTNHNMWTEVRVMFASVKPHLEFICPVFLFCDLTCLIVRANKQL